MVLECRLVHHYELGLHTHFVGEILDVKIREEAFDAEGMPDIHKIKPLYSRRRSAIITGSAGHRESLQHREKIAKRINADMATNLCSCAGNQASASQQTASSSEQLAATAQMMKNSSEELNRLVQFFRL
jgi:hypothetical protein